MFSLAFYMLMPVARTAYAVLVAGSVTATTYRPLYYDKYYYVDVSSVEAGVVGGRTALLLAASTVLASAATFVNATAFIAVPQLFGGLCVYVRAMYDELFGMLAHVDAERRGRRQRLQLAIRYHAAVLE